MLIKCMQTLPKPKTPTSEAAVSNDEPADQEHGPAKRRPYASYIASTTGQNLVKPTDHRTNDVQHGNSSAATQAMGKSAVLPGMYTPSMLRQTNQMKKTKYQLALAAKSARSANTTVKPAVIASSQQSGDVKSTTSGAGAKKLTDFPKPAVNPFKGLKEKLKMMKGNQSSSPEPSAVITDAAATDAEGPKNKQQLIKSQTASKSVQPSHSSQNTQTVKPFIQPAQHKTADLIETESTDDETQGSDSDLAVPKLSYRKRLVVSSAESATESETDSPTRAARRRSQRIIDSDSEAEEALIKRPSIKGKNRFRRTPSKLS